MLVQEGLCIEDKLRILSDAAKYDVACTSSGVDRRGKSGSLGNSIASGICHSFSADGRCISLLKILFTNQCIYDCKYCINRCSNDTLRTAFTPDEVCRLTMEFYQRNYIEGLFLSSGILYSADHTMDLLYQTLWKLRKECRFNGYIHVKAIPGADPALIEQVGFLADRMSVNLELPTAEGLRELAPGKTRDKILKPMRLIQRGIVRQMEEAGMQVPERSAALRRESRIGAASPLPDLRPSIRSGDPAACSRSTADPVHLTVASQGAAPPVYPSTGHQSPAHPVDPSAAFQGTADPVRRPAGPQRSVRPVDPSAGLGCADSPGQPSAASRQRPLPESESLDIDGSPGAYRPSAASRSSANGRSAPLTRPAGPKQPLGRSRYGDHGVPRVSGGKAHFVPAGQSTQMIVGATKEDDRQMLMVAEALYRNFGLKRVFYSAYVSVNADSALPVLAEGPPLLREHRLYQADWLLRYYGFDAEELLSEDQPNFNVFLDPKCDWALRNLGQFPVEVNTAGYETLLRVPGMGVKSVSRIVAARKTAALTFADLKKLGVVLKRAQYFITCSGKLMDYVKIDRDVITSCLLGDERRRAWDITHKDSYRQLSLFDDLHLEAIPAAGRQLLP